VSVRRLSVAADKVGISPFRKQNLSPSAAKAKAERDLAAANTPDREAKRASSQREKRAAIKAGTYVTGKDYDHKRQKYVSRESNRGNEGEGTKKEGDNNYKTT